MAEHSPRPPSDPKTRVPAANKADDVVSLPDINIRGVQSYLDLFLQIEQRDIRHLSLARCARLANGMAVNALSICAYKSYELEIDGLVKNRIFSFLGSEVGVTGADGKRLGTLEERNQERVEQQVEKIVLAEYGYAVGLHVYFGGGECVAPVDRHGRAKFWKLGDRAKVAVKDLHDMQLQCRDSGTVYYLHPGGSNYVRAPTVHQLTLPGNNVVDLHFRLTLPTHVDVDDLHLDDFAYHPGEDGGGPGSISRMSLSFPGFGELYDEFDDLYDKFLDDQHPYYDHDFVFLLHFLEEKKYDGDVFITEVEVEPGFEMLCQDCDGGTVIYCPRCGRRQNED